METINVIKINDTVNLFVQCDENGKPFISRLRIKGMPLQPRDNMGGLYPTKSTVIRGLMEYGFVVVEEFNDEDLKGTEGILGKKFLESLNKIFKN